MENHYYYIKSFRMLIQRDNNEISCEISVINLYANCVWSAVCTLAGSVHRQWAIYDLITFAGSWHWQILCFRLYFEKKDLCLRSSHWFDSIPAPWMSATIGDRRSAALFITDSWDVLYTWLRWICRYVFYLWFVRMSCTSFSCLLSRSERIRAVILSLGDDREIWKKTSVSWAIY